MKTRYASTLLALSMVACQGARTDEAAETVTGRYVWGAEVNVFSPCGSEAEYWVVGAPSIVQALRDEYVSLHLAPYAAVFLEVRGEVGPVLDCGFCESYDGSFRVEEVLRMESPGPGSCLD